MGVARRFLFGYIRFFDGMACRVVGHWPILMVISLGRLK